MNFSQVKELSIPEGSVKQITDSQGRVLWKKSGAGPTWHTVWEGNNEYSTIGISEGDDVGPTIALTQSVTQGSNNTRFTMSWTVAGGDLDTDISGITSAQGSGVIIINQDEYIASIISGSNGVIVEMRIDNDTTFNPYASQKFGDDASVAFTITKVEQLY